MNFAILCLLILLKELLKDNKKRLIGYPVRRLSFQSYFLGFIWDIPQTTKNRNRKFFKGTPCRQSKRIEII